MKPTPQIVFATNFSDACYRAIPAVASWVDTLKARLTILHVCDPKRYSPRASEAYLKSFFAEADLFCNCERVLKLGTPYEGIAEYAEKHPGALLVLPPSDRVGFPRPFHQSIRAKLLREHSCPIWTIGRPAEGRAVVNAEDNIACWLECPEDGITHLREAATLAAHKKARLHLLCTIPSIEELDEGALGKVLTSNSPFGEEYAEDWLKSIGHTLGIEYELHITAGSARRVLPKMVKQTGASVLFVSRSSAIRSDSFGLKLNSALDACDHAVICFPPACQLLVMPSMQQAQVA